MYSKYIIKFSHHALNRIMQRGISKEEVIDGILYPYKTVKLSAGVIRYIKHRSNYHLLIIYCAPNKSGCTVITAFSTSQVSKFLTN